MDTNALNDVNPHIMHCSHFSRAYCPPPGTRFGERTVKWHEIELITWGEGCIITEGKNLPTAKGDIFFRTPGMVVQGISPYHCYLIVFDPFYDAGRKSEYDDPDYLDAGSGETKAGCSRIAGKLPTPFNFPPVIKAVQFDRYEEIFSDMFNQYVFVDKTNQFYLKARLFQILLMLHTEISNTRRLHSSKRSVCLNYPKVTAARQYMEENCTRRLTLEELAAAAGLSPNFFCRIFREITGQTPVDCINRYRLNKAKKMLIETNMKIKEISIECGFDNESYFFTLFKRHEGISPVSFRERQRMMFLYREP